MPATNPTPKPDAARARLYKLLALANRSLSDARPGWLEDDYRQILRQCGAKQQGGRYTAKTMSVPQMEQALARFKALGFTPRKNRSNGDWRSARVAKLNAMWCQLADAGVVANRSQYAMEQFCINKVPGFTRLRWATSDHLNKAVEVLKAFKNSRGLTQQ